MLPGRPALQVLDSDQYAQRHEDKLGWVVSPAAAGPPAYTDAGGAEEKPDCRPALPGGPGMPVAAAVPRP